MFATVLDSAKIALMGKHAYKTAHSDVYFQHSADYFLKHFLSFLPIFIIQSFRIKLSMKSTERTQHIHAETRVLQFHCVLAPKRYMYGIHDISSKRSSLKRISSKRHIVEYDISSKTI